jgi:hypothetical protein
MLVHDSRILQVTLFETLQNNLSALDFSLQLPDVMTIADEVDSQLTQNDGQLRERRAESSGSVVHLYRTQKDVKTLQKQPHSQSGQSRSFGFSALYVWRASVSME